MKISRTLALASLMAMAAGPVSAFNLNDAVNAAATLQNGNQNGTVTAPPQTAGLLNTLGSQLNVTPQQAVGGTGAMLGLAKNRLSSTDYAQLSQAVPGIDMLSGSNALGALNGLEGLLGKNAGNGDQTALNSALGNVQNVGDMNKAFSALGMDSGMIAQFAPLILQYFGQQGVGGSLLQNLGSLWGTGTR